MEEAAHLVVGAHAPVFGAGDDDGRAGVGERARTLAGAVRTR